MLNQLPLDRYLEPKTFIHYKLGCLCYSSVDVFQVGRWFELTKGEVPIIGVGGVETGRDVLEYFLAGASAVQVGSQLMKEGVGVFSRYEKHYLMKLTTKRLQKEVTDELSRKGVASLSELIGRAKPRTTPAEGTENY